MGSFESIVSTQNSASARVLRQFQIVLRALRHDLRGKQAKKKLLEGKRRRRRLVALIQLTLDSYCQPWDKTVDDSASHMVHLREKASEH